VVLLAYEIEFRSCLDMACEAVHPEPVVDFHEATPVDLGTLRRDIDEEELPVACYRVEALLMLDHDLVRHELQNRALRVVAFPLLGDGDGRRNVAERVVDVEVANRRHLPDAFERGVIDLETGLHLVASAHLCVDEQQTASKQRLPRALPHEP